MKSASKRIKWLDFAKGLLILFVIICHSGFAGENVYHTLSYVLLMLVMPLFFAISGFLYKPTKDWSHYKLLLYKKISSFVIPYVIVTFMDVILRVTTNHNILDNLYRLYLIPVEYLWFIYVLFLIFLIVGFLDLLHINIWIQLCISFILLIGQIYLPWQAGMKGYNPLAGIGGYMICFYLGNIIKEFNLSRFLKDKMLLISLATLWVVVVIMTLFITGNNYNTDVMNYADIVPKLLSIPVFFSLFMRCNHNGFFRYFDKYGKYTLVIYLVHLPIITIICKLLLKASIFHGPYLFVLITMASWFISIFVCYLAENVKLINFVFYPRKYIDKVVLKTKWGRRLLEK